MVRAGALTEFGAFIARREWTAIKLSRMQGEALCVSPCILGDIFVGAIVFLNILSSQTSYLTA